MSNHCIVKTRKKMTPEAIEKLLTDLNQQKFKSNLKIEKSSKNAWEIEYISSSNNASWGRRSIWLNGPRNFEIRHGPGDFMWWVDITITNQIALEFNGMIYDEGISTKIQPKIDFYPSPIDWLQTFYVRVWTRDKDFLISEYYLPPEFTT